MLIDDMMLNLRTPRIPRNLWEFVKSFGTEKPGWNSKSCLTCIWNFWLISRNLEPELFKLV